VERAAFRATGIAIAYRRLSARMRAPRDSTMVAARRRNLDMETLAFNTDFNSVGGFLVNVALGVVAGALLALLCRQWQVRRALRAALRAERGLALAAFTLPTLLFGVWAYVSYLTPFFAAHVSPRAITFEYRFPSREVTVARSDVDRVVKGADGDQGPWVNLVVYTKDGRRFESVPIRADRFEGLRGRLRPTS
jgi:hypothetical protein